MNYYASIGWISDLVAQRLLELASIENRYKGVSWTLSAQEQRISRLYIEKLKGHDIEESLLQVPFPGKARPDLEKNKESMRNKIYMGLMDQNIRIKKVARKK